MESELTKYLNDLKKGRDTAERSYLVRRSVWERASTAYGKTQQIESAFKDSWDRIEKVDESADAISSTLLRAAKTGVTVNDNTDKARQASELLTYEILDILCLADTIAKELEDVKKEVLNKLTPDKPIAGCIDKVLKTLPDINKNAKEALDKTLSVVGSIHDIQAAIADNCGINARLIGLAKQLQDCGLSDCPPSIGEDPIAKFTCVTPKMDAIEDNACSSQYSTYLSTPLPACDRDLKATFNKYRSDTEVNYKKAKKKTEVTLAWLNCTAEQKNATEASFNACKAAYDAAKAANKC